MIGDKWLRRQMKYETEGERQMMEDTHKGEQTKEADTTIKADR
jgi:hypothetical protein